MASNKEIMEADKEIKDFFDNFGENDIYKRVFFEVLLEEVYGKKIDLSDIIK